MFVFLSYCIFHLFVFIRNYTSHIQAVSDLETCFESGAGKDDSQVRMKLQEAKRLLKKSKRVNLYELLGCPRGEMSSEQEIAKAYKKMALKWHPDRHSSKVITSNR